MRRVYGVLGVLALGAVIWGCSSGGGSSSGSSSSESCSSGTDVVETVGTGLVSDASKVLSCTTNIATDAPDWIKNNFHCVTVQVCSSTYKFITTSLPPYKTDYYTTASKWFTGAGTGSGTMGLSDGSTRHENPNSISSQNITFTIPKTPSYDSTPDSNMGSGLDCIGLTRYGVCIFNNQANPPDSLTTEFLTMDNGDGHPQNTGKYHHHTEPYYLSKSDAKFIGVALDGYPIYGRLTSTGTGGAPTLDSAHTEAACTTAEFTNTQCYHVQITGTAGTGVDHYIFNTVFRGTKGSVQ